MCLSWVNINRICLGHSDGSITLWSIYPQRMIMRQSIHISYILDIKSAYPSHPYHIVTTPVGGCPTLTDLNLPGAERTYIPLSNAINFQHNLLDWNDHLQGFLLLHPSPSPHNSIIGIAHVRYFIQSRSLMTVPSKPMCLGAGKTHPFVLVGCADGSLWAFNALRVMLKDRQDPMYKMKVFEHEYRPIKTAPVTAPQGSGDEPEDIRGASRILQGFVPLVNTNPRAEYIREINIQRGNQARAKAAGGTSKQEAKQPEVEDMFLEGINMDGEQYIETLKGDAKISAAIQATVNEALTRITNVVWNPNVEFGWWAAASMGSGLIKVMDLGIEGE